MCAKLCTRYAHGLTNMLALILQVTSSLLAIAAIVIAYRRAAPSLTRRIAERMTKLEEHFIDLDERQDSTLASLKRLHSRAGMREVRDQRGNGKLGPPDPLTDPEGWKKYMRAKHGLFPTKSEH